MRIHPFVLAAVAVLSAGCAARHPNPDPVVILTPTRPPAQDEQPREEEAIDIVGLPEPLRDFPEHNAPAEDRREMLLSAARALLPAPSGADLEGERLHVRGTAEERRRVRSMVELLRRPPDFLFTATVTFFSVRNPSKERPQVRRLSFDGSLCATLQAAAVLAGAPTLQSPRLSMHPGQRGHVRVGEDRAYVGEHEIRFDAQGNAAVDPVISVLRTGTAVSLRPIALSADGREALLHDLRVSLSGYGARTLDRVETSLGPVEVPRVATLRCRMDVPIVQGEAVLVGPLPPPDPEDSSFGLWLLVTCGPRND